MKKFLVKASFFGIFCLLVGVAFPLWLDPYNVFHAAHIRDNGITPNKNYIKMTYLLSHPDTFDALLFGSSRVGAIHTEKISGLKCYNMTYSAGLPEEHLNNLKTLIAHSVVPKVVFLGVDSVSYTTLPSIHFHNPATAPYEYVVGDYKKFMGLYLNAGIAVRSIPVAIKNQRRSESSDIDHYMIEQFYSTGVTYPYQSPSKYNWKEVDVVIGSDNLMDETIATLSEIADLCREHGIKLVVFTNPMYPVTYEASVERDWFTFLERLAEVTDFYNFSGLNAVTVEKGNFRDSSHYTSEVGDLILDCICGNTVPEGLLEQGFGLYVTRDNIQQLLQILRSQIFER